MPPPSSRRPAASDAIPAAPIAPRRRLLITAGPTHEPIDAVRYIGNRSSGRLGVALADHAAAHGWSTTLLLGPTALSPSDSSVRLHRFRTTAQLEALLSEQFPSCDVLIMAAAVADYRPLANDSPGAAPAAVKLRRTDQKLLIELEPTPDLLAACGRDKRPDQFLVGFALEPRERLLESAAAKLKKKHLDLIVANPLETMDSETIEATVLGRDGSRVQTPGAVAKTQFAGWLLDTVDRARSHR